MLEALGFQRIHWHDANKSLFMNKWSKCTPLKKMNYWWLLASRVFCACANHIWMAPVHPHTHSREIIHPALLRCILLQQLHFASFAKGWCCATPHSCDKAEASCFTNRKQGLSKLKKCILQNTVKIGPVYINKMLLNASGNHLPQQTLIESEGVEPWVLDTTKETLCTQRFLCAEYQWRKAMHNQRLKASFHSLTHFYQPEHKQRSLPGGRDKLHLKDTFHMLTVARRCEKVSFTPDCRKHSKHK